MNDANTTSAQLGTSSPGKPVRDWLEAARKDPAVWLIGAISALLFWYVATQVSPDIKSVQQRNQKISDTLANVNTSQELISAKLDELKNSIDGRFETLEDKMALRERDFDTRFVGIENTIDSKVIEVEARFTDRLTAQKNTLEEGLGEVQDQVTTQEKLLDTDDVADELDQQKSELASINREFSDTNRKVAVLGILSEQGIDSPILEQTLLRITKDNPLFTLAPESLIHLWASRKQHKATDYVETLITDYKIDRKAAMLIVYDALTEIKPIRYFVEDEEIKAKTTPKLAAAKPKPTEDTAVPLAQPLSIARVCEEKFQQKLTECYEYFLSIADSVPVGEISFDSPSDEAVLRLIVNKHDDKIPSS